MTRTNRSRARPRHDDQAPIVVGVDPGGRSTSAVLWAAEEAERTDSPLHLVTAYPSESAHRDGGSAPGDLAGVARRLTQADLRYEARIGSPVSVLLDAAAEGRMLVVGRRGYSGGQRRLLGSISMAVAGRCPVPVIVAPEPWLQPSMSTAALVVGIGVRRSGCAELSEDQDSATAALDFAFDRANLLRVPLVVVHAREVPGLEASAPEQASGDVARECTELEARLGPWRAVYPDVEVALRCVADTPRRALSDAARFAQLTVLGRHAGDPWLGGQLGSTARAFLHQAQRPVALVPVTSVGYTFGMERDDARL